MKRRIDKMAVLPPLLLGVAFFAAGVLSIVKPFYYTTPSTVTRMGNVPSTAHPVDSPTVGFGVVFLIIAFACFYLSYRATKY